MPPPLAARRLLFVIQALHVGGAELQLFHLTRALSGDGHDVTLCCIDEATLDVDPLRDAGVNVVELGARGRGARAAAIPRLARLARKADVVHCTMWDASLWGRLAAIVTRRPVVVADHATDRSVQVAASGAPRATWIARHNRLLDRFTFATVVCASSQHEVLVGEGVARDKIVHIPNGVPVDEIRAAASGAPARRALGLPAAARVVIQVGVFRPEKNQMGALEALAAVHDRAEDVHLVFVGDGELRPAVERRAQELGADWVHFLGFRDDVPALLTLADVMILPSVSDAMPMTVLEALAQGVPVVATDVGAVKATLDGGGGIVVPIGDSAALERACLGLLADEALRAEVAAAGRDNAKRFDATAMAQRYAALFEAAAIGMHPNATTPVGLNAVPAHVPDETLTAAPTAGTRGRRPA